MILIEHADAESLVRACGTALARAVSEAHAARRGALLALAGGRTAPPILRAMAAGCPDGATLTVLPTDERWVPPGHPDHNLAQLEGALAVLPGATILGLAPAALKAWPAAPQPDVALERLADLRDRDFDAVLLGMGPDGHFASLFPGADNLAEGLDPACTADALVIHPRPLPTAGPWPRITLTLARLLRARHVLLAITGTEKRAVLARALAGDPALPVSALLAQNHTPVTVHWSI